MSAFSRTRSEVLARSIGVWRGVARDSPPRHLVGVTKRLMRDYGYARSLRLGAPVQGKGEPVPWYTFSAIEYLQGLDLSGRRVFEFGAGNSTLFWQARAAEVVSVETDPEWYHQLVPRIAGNARLVLCGDQDAYLTEITDHGSFDVIVVDGLWRKPSARVALEHLAPGGMIILDNADWFPHSHALLRAAGLVEVDFHGLGPIARYAWTTSIFLDRTADFWSTAGPPHPIGGILPPEMLAVDAEG
ncbi:MAG: class I SAM-dependent methyltransferase [Acidimicrobiia bacterium]|nr:class I SAM-dependent methyltransferase [Acidimicrobiia bacterium]